MKSLLIFELKKFISFRVNFYFFLLLFALSIFILILSSVKLGNVNVHSSAERYFLSTDGYLLLFWAISNLIFPFIVIHFLYLDRNFLNLNWIKYLPNTFLEFYLSRAFLLCLFLLTIGMLFGSFLIMKLYNLNLGNILFFSHFIVFKWIMYISIISCLYYILILSVFLYSKSALITLFFHLLNIFLGAVGSQIWVPINWSKFVIELLRHSN